MASSFTNNTPNGNVANRAKFPFILMPVSSAGDVGRNPEILPPLHVDVDGNIPPLSARSPSKSFRRNTMVQKELRTRYLPRNVDQYSPSDQLCRPAQTLYTSKTISQPNLAEDSFLPNNNNSGGATLLYNGIQIQEIVRPRVVQRSRNSVKYRTPIPSTTLNEIVVHASTSTPQVVHGRVNSANIADSSKNPAFKNEIDRMGIELKEKEKELIQLKNEMKGLREAVENSNHEAQASKAQCMTLRLEFTRLDRQMESLEERFDNHEELNNLKEFIITQLALCSQPMISSNQNSNKSSLPKSPDYDRLINMIRELNTIAGNYQSVELCYITGGATFKRPEALVLSLYKNGMTLDDNDVFRPFDTAATAQFIQDIYDGYFPTELQAKYPDGITLVVKDKRHVLHPSDSAFPGKGKSLTDSDKLQNLPTFYPGMKLLQPQKQEYIIHPTSSTESTFSDSSIASDASYETLPDLLPTQTSLSQPQRALYKIPCKFITLKLKNLKTEISYKFKTTSTATPDDILLHLETQLEGPASAFEENGVRRYELVNSFPFGTFSTGGTTLREYGIASNSLIFFRPI